MGRSKAKKPKDPQLRVFWLGVFILTGFIVLILRLWHLQILQGEYFAEMSDQNRIRIFRVKAPRGVIYDRNHIPLATNRPSFKACFIREDLKRHSLDKVVQRLSRLIGLNPQEATAKIVKAEARDRRPFVPITLKFDLSFEEVARLEEHRPELPGITVEIEPVRSYPFGKAAAHVLGYMGEVSEAQLAKPRYSGTKSGDLVGQAGLEKIFQSSLRGQDGSRQVEVNAKGRELVVLREQLPRPGNNLILSLDINLQLKAEELFAGKEGAIIALDPRNGEVLFWASLPAYDPNLFAVGISSKRWREIINNPKDPLQNRAIQGQYPPGSVFKTVMALAALEEGIVTSDTHLTCYGFFRLSPRSRKIYDCWKWRGHGSINIHESLVHSCNVFYYQVGNKLGLENISKWAFNFRLGKPTGIELPNEKTGLVPTNAWKLKAVGERWYPGETISISIGQGFLSVTPLQLASVINTIANGGIIYRPKLVDRIISPQGDNIREYPKEVLSRINARPKSFKIVRQGLHGVVNERGTATRARIPGLGVSGKTGTAQVIRKRTLQEKKKKGEVPEKFKDHAWFVSFAPVEDPQIAMAILVEHGGQGGRACAPIAKQMIAEYFKRYNPERLLAAAEAAAAAAAIKKTTGAAKSAGVTSPGGD